MVRAEYAKMMEVRDDKSHCSCNLKACCAPGKCHLKMFVGGQTCKGPAKKRDQDMAASHIPDTGQANIKSGDRGAAGTGTAAWSVN